MKKYIIYIVIIVCLIISVIAINYIIEHKKVQEYYNELVGLSAQDTVLEYIKCVNENNYSKELLMYPEEQRQHVKKSSVEYCTLLSVKEESVTEQDKKKYADSIGIERFSVEYSVKWRRDPPYPDGTYCRYFTLVKYRENEPWVIEHHGFG